MSETTNMQPRKIRRRGGARRAATAGDAKGTPLAQQAPGQVKLSFEPTRVVSADELESWWSNWEAKHTIRPFLK